MTATSVTDFLRNGCGRCEHYGTDACKVRHFNAEVKRLREIVLDCGLAETLKWSQLCYTYDEKNVVLVSAFKEFAFIGFFKGTLLTGNRDILMAPGPNSQHLRRVEVRTLNEIEQLEPILRKLIKQAIELEKKGIKSEVVKNDEPLCAELLACFAKDPELEKAFQALTPGRQRGYNLYFSQAKQAKTRLARIVKYTPQILAGQGLHDDYRSRK